MSGDIAREAVAIINMDSMIKNSTKDSIKVFQNSRNRHI